MMTVRTLTVVAASSWTISHMDVKNVFLHGDLHEDPPPLQVLIFLLDMSAAFVKLYMALNRLLVLGFNGSSL